MRFYFYKLIYMNNLTYLLFGVFVEYTMYSILKIHIIEVVFCTHYHTDWLGVECSSFENFRCFKYCNGLISAQFRRWLCYYRFSFAKKEPSVYLKSPGCNETSNYPLSR